MCVFSNAYSPRQGQTTHWGQNFYDNRKTFSLCPYVASFKMISLKSDFVHIFFLIILYMYIALRQGQTNPWVQNFDVNRLLLPLRPFVAKQKNLFEFRFYTHFFMFFFFTCIYSPGAGADNPLWTKFWCQQKGLVTLPICCKFGYGEEDFWRDVTIYGRDGHLGHVT